MFSVLMSPWKIFLAWQSRTAESSWKAIHRFSISSRKGRRLQRYISVSTSHFAVLHLPEALVDGAIDELPDEISIATGLESTVVGEHVRDISQDVPLACDTDW